MSEIAARALCLVQISDKMRRPKPEERVGPGEWNSRKSRDFRGKIPLIDISSARSTVSSCQSHRFNEDASGSST
jgi:hypothetical protein